MRHEDLLVALREVLNEQARDPKWSLAMTGQDSEPAAPGKVTEQLGQIFHDIPQRRILLSVAS